MSKPYAPEQYDEQKVLHFRLNELLSQEETYWRQRSHILWLKEGDRNSSFFHRRASNRRSRNKIKGLTNEEGYWHDNPDEVSVFLIRYYENIFKFEGSDLEAMREVIDTVKPRVSPTMNESLLASYTNEEIKKALFQMHPSKSFG